MVLNSSKKPKEIPQKVEGIWQVMEKNPTACHFYLFG